MQAPEGFPRDPARNPVLPYSTDDNSGLQYNTNTAGRDPGGVRSVEQPAPR
jgi:hypothetical protein